MKKILTLLLIIALCFTLTPNTASAAVKINKTKVTLDVGKTVTLKISGTNKAIKWASSDEAVATVTPKGKVTANEAGTSTITATVSKKKYTCKLTVSDGFDAVTASKNIEGKFADLGNEVIGILTNSNKYPVSLSVTIIFYGADDSMLGKASNNNYYFESGKQCALSFIGPYDSNTYKDIEYSSYKTSHSIDRVGSKKSNVSDVKTVSNIGADNVMVEATNSGSATSEYTQIALIYYKNGQAIGYDYQYADCQTPGSVGYLEFSLPYDSNYDTIQIDNYEVYVNSSYYYTW